MTQEDLRNELPIAWEVVSVWSRDEFVHPIGKPLTKRFATQVEAHAYKKGRQSAGWIASIRPIFISRAKRTAALRRRQSTPFGSDFCAGWRLTD
jgi:hypothetical protein